MHCLPRGDALTTKQSIRMAHHVSQLWVAAAANVSIPLVRLYEKGGPDAVSDVAKRNDLDRVYSDLAARAG